MHRSFMAPVIIFLNFSLPAMEPKPAELNIAMVSLADAAASNKKIIVATPSSTAALNKKMYPCSYPECNRTFNYACRLREHVKKHKADSLGVLCRCGTLLNSSKNLRRHQRTSEHRTSLINKQKNQAQKGLLLLYMAGYAEEQTPNS